MTVADDYPKSRVLGGFAVIPTSITLGRIRRPQTRAAAIGRALNFLKILEQRLRRLRAETAIELHDSHGLTWEQVAGHCRAPMPTVYGDAAKLLAEQRATTKRAEQRADLASAA